MATERQRPGPISGGELKAVLTAERAGAPFFVYRDAGGEQRIVGFPEGRSELTVGRNAAADMSLGWDDQVSALHTVIELLAGELTVLDDGLSRNGSYVNGERINGRRRLRDGDLLQVGRTVLLVRNPADALRSATAAASQPLQPPQLSARQRAVLAVLCRGLEGRDGLGTIATNQEIAEELHLSVAAVKLHLRALFDKFAVAELPQNKKRLALAQRALQSGVLSAPRSTL